MFKAECNEEDLETLDSDSRNDEQQSFDIKKLDKTRKKYLPENVEYIC